MNRWITLCACIFVLLAIPFAVTAALVGDGNATMTPGNQTGNQTGNETGNMTVAGYIAQDQNLTRLARALNVTGLYDTLNTGGPYTVFAPNNEAFNALGNVTVNQLFNETTNLTTVLQYHVVKGEYTSANLTSMAGNQTDNQTSGGVLGVLSGLLGGGNQTGNATENMTRNQTGNMTTLKTLTGENLNITVSDGQIMVENANVTMKDINTTNGVIHIIDRVLMPPGLNLTTTGNQTTAGYQTGMTGNTTMA
ncbi:fasciclin domain-containing protein [Methanoculleus sp. UBA303]|jgi:uncharacterized surface protein with fasciclin (FAS1) repeats|uniref:fasciclin domain-containing protein n=1 Tax=Methanoculleus sp. UBA303 TaxID=1915497 RepID=UPI0025E09753|nr:fasciclin domain-containing protein [Methanoculleus sp. UBA303]